MFANSTVVWYYYLMKREYQKTLEAIFSYPVSANIKWHYIESLFTALGAELIERESSRIGLMKYVFFTVLIPDQILIRERLQALDNG